MSLGLRTVLPSLFVAVALSACSDHPDPVMLEAGEEPDGTGVIVDVVTQHPTGSATITVVIRWSGEVQLAGLQGRLRWDPARLTFSGQIPEPGTIVAAAPNPATGVMELVAVNPTGLSEHAAILTFEAPASGEIGAIIFEPTIALDAAGRRLTAVAGSTIRSDGLPDSSAGRVMTWDDWLDLLTPRRSGDLPVPAPGAGQRYGDANLDGVVDVLDALATSLRSVGLEEIIVGTNVSNEDFVVAANVGPFNLPGLGGVSDQCAPGVDVCGTVKRTIDVLDALFISLESVGDDQPVVGEAIPRAAPTGVGSLTGPVTTSRTLSPDTTYELDGVVRVDSGGVLTVPAGTRIVGDAGAMLVVTRRGRLEVHGSPIDPVVMTCAGSAEDRGCWGGLVLAGNAPVNRGAPSSPPAPGNGLAGCLQISEDASVGPYGGCDPNDDRGSIEFLRVEFATRGVELLAVGRGTHIDNLQVHGALTSGVTVGGGTADLRRILITATQGDGLSWRDGWLGRSQFLIVQLDPVTGSSGLAGRNAVGNPDAAPFSRPTLFNTTVVGVDFPPTGAAVSLSEGSGAEIHNLVAIGLPDPGAGLPHGLDIDGAATCSRVGDGLVVRNSVFAGIPNPGDPDSDPGCSGDPMVESGVITAGGGVIITDQAAIATLIKAATDPFLPDFRGTPTGALAGVAASVPPDDGFFDTQGSFPGGSEIATGSQPNIPWYAGWTRGGIGMNVSTGSIAGRITDAGTPVSAVGVIAESADVAASTDDSGHYSLPFVRPGMTAVVLANLPLDCADPGPIPVSVISGNTTTLDIALACGGTDVSIQKAGPATATAGDTVTYVVVTRNDGPAVADSVAVVDTLPPSAIFVSATRGGIFTAPAVEWPTLPGLAAGAVNVDSVRVVLTAAGTVVNLAQATVLGALDPNPGNNRATASTTVEDALPAAQLLPSDSALIDWQATAGFSEWFNATMRWGKNLNPAQSFEIAIRPDGDAPTLDQAELVWATDPQPFHFVYDPTETVEASIAVVESPGDTVRSSASVDSLVSSPVNTIAIRARANPADEQNATLVFTVRLPTGEVVFAPPSPLVGDAGSFGTTGEIWVIHDPRLAGGFEVLGTADLDSSATNQGDSPAFQIKVGSAN